MVTAGPVLRSMTRGRVAIPYRSNRCVSTAAALADVRRDPKRVTSLPVLTALALYQHVKRTPSPLVEQLQPLITTSLLHHYDIYTFVNGPVHLFIQSLEFARDLPEPLPLLRHIAARFTADSAAFLPEHVVRIVRFVALFKSDAHRQLLLNRIVPPIRLHRYSPDQMVNLIAAMAQLPRPFRPFIAYLGVVGPFLVPRCSFAQTSSLVRGAIMDFDRESPLIRSCQRHLTQLLSTSLRSDHVPHAIHTFNSLARAAAVDPITLRAFVTAAQSVPFRSVPFPLLSSLVESVSRVANGSEFHARLLAVLVPDALPGLSFQSLSRLLSGLQKPLDAVMDGHILSVCRCIVSVPEPIPVEFIASYGHSLAISRSYSPAVLARLCSDLVPHLVTSGRVSHESLAKLLLALATFCHAPTPEFSAAVSTYIDRQLDAVDDPRYLTRIVWSLSVLSIGSDHRLICRNILRFNGLYNKANLRFIHDVLFDLDGSGVLTPFPTSLGKLFSDSRAIRSAVVVPRWDFEDAVVASLARLNVPFTRRARIGRSGYRYDLVLEQLKTVIVINGADRYGRGSRLLLGVDVIAQRYVAHMAWSIWSVPFWTWDRFSAEPESLDRAIQAAIASSGNLELHPLSSIEASTT